MATISLKMNLNISNYISKIETNEYTKNGCILPNQNSFEPYELSKLKKNNGKIVYPFSITNDSIIAQSTIGYAKAIDPNSYNGLIFGLSDMYGKYPLELKIYGGGKIKFYFDKTAGQYPKKYIIEYLDKTTNTFYINEGENENWNEEEYSLTIYLQENDSPFRKYQKITFDEWNRYEYYTSIIYIETLNVQDIIYDEYINNLSTTSELNNNGEEIYYGALPNDGIIEINDINDTFYKYLEINYFTSNIIDVSININDKQIQNHILNDSNYIYESRQMTFNLTNYLSLWSDIQTKDIFFLFQTNLYNVLVTLFEQNEKKIYSSSLKINLEKALSNKIYISKNAPSVTIKDYMKSIKIPNFFTLKSDSFINQINKICDVAQLYLNVNDDNEIMFYNGRPLIEDSEDILKINDDILSESPQTSLITKNIYTDVEFN